MKKSLREHTPIRPGEVAATAGVQRSRAGGEGLRTDNVEVSGLGVRLGGACKLGFYRLAARAPRRKVLEHDELRALLRHGKRRLELWSAANPPEAARRRRLPVGHGLARQLHTRVPPV